MLTAFQQQIQVALDGADEQVRAAHVKAAKDALAAATGGDFFPAKVITIVDRREGAALESVQVPGQILFRLGRLQEAAYWGLKKAKALSPVKSGRYRDAWLALVGTDLAGGGKLWNGQQIGPDEVLTIVNPVPYARKIQTRGAKQLAIPAGVVDRLSNALKAQFGTKSYETDVEFISLATSEGLKNYRLARPGRRNFKNAGGYVSRRGLRYGDANKGSAINYPAVVMRQKRSFD